MAITYPTTLDAFTNPTAASLLTSPSHAQQHSDINDAVEALETKVAIGNTVLGTYTAYTPTLSNVTIGNAKVNTRYCRVNDLVHYYGMITFCSTTVITGSAWEISLPINVGGVNNFTSPIGSTILYDDSAGQIYPASVLRIASSTSLRLMINVAGQLYITNLSATTPFTWTTNDKIGFNLIYQAA